MRQSRYRSSVATPAVCGVVAFLSSFLCTFSNCLSFLPTLSFLLAHLSLLLANLSFLFANLSFPLTNLSFNPANLFFPLANLSFPLVNLSFLLANLSFLLADLAFLRANLAFLQANLSFLLANLSFLLAILSFLFTYLSFLLANLSFLADLPFIPNFFSFFTCLFFCLCGSAGCFLLSIPLAGFHRNGFSSIICISFRVLHFCIMEMFSAVTTWMMIHDDCFEALCLPALLQPPIILFSYTYTTIHLKSNNNIDMSVTPFLWKYHWSCLFRFNFKFD